MEPPRPDPHGTGTGWLLPGTRLLVDATCTWIRLWCCREGALENAVNVVEEGFGPIFGAVLPCRQGLLVAHVADRPCRRTANLVVRSVPELAVTREWQEPGASHLRLSPEAAGRGFLASSRDDQPPVTVLLNEDLQVEARWNEPLWGASLWWRERGWVVSSRCERGASGVDIREAATGRLLESLAEQDPVTHVVHVWGGELWLFQEEGWLRSGDRRLQLGEFGFAGHHFDRGGISCVVTAGEMSATCSTDGRVTLWRLPDWSRAAELACDDLPIWVEMDGSLLAVGYATDAIELYRIA